MTKPIANTYSEQVALIDINKPVRCYRNLHTGLWSVKQGVVKFHCSHIFLKNVKFLVNERLRQRVITEKRKNVHAFVVGEIRDTPDYFTRGTDAAGVYYNPYKHSTFVCGDAPIYESVVCLLHKSEDSMHVSVDMISAYYAKMMNKELDLQRSCVTMDSMETHLL